MCPGNLAGRCRRVRAVLAAARRSQADGADPRYTLWQAWHRSGLQRRWLAASERGGAAGVQADRDLDAVTALFDVAEQYVSRTAGASLRGLVDHVRALGRCPRRDDPPCRVDGVALVSAHAALGREWDFVVIAGLQEGLWPNTDSARRRARHPAARRRPRRGRRTTARPACPAGRRCSPRSAGC